MFRKNTNAYDSLFKRVMKFQAAILACGILALTCSLPAQAGETRGCGANSITDDVPQQLLNLDLCTLAYQFYHQSLCLPLDPWYDIMSRVGSDRRNNICRLTHEYASTLASLNPSGAYSGPNSVRGWQNSNFNLDPILTNFKQIDKQLPAFTRDGERFLAVVAPEYITKNIKSIEGIRYRTKPNSFPFNEVERFAIREYPDGQDHLIVFEGGTGNAGDTQPSWSPMGFVMMRKTSTGYDAHIVFRGSRSGSALSKTVWRAQDYLGEHKGNPDWITDLRSSKQIDQPLIGRVGTVTQGFAEALPTMLGPITASCKYLSQKYPTPEHIFVTGHSLGAGLASQYVSSVLLGDYGSELRKEIQNWPWDKTTLVVFAQPIPGNPAWANDFDKAAPTAEHYWVDGDAVVEATSNRIVGLMIDKGEHCGVQKKLNKVANCNDNVHEVFVIRAAILRDLAAVNSAAAQTYGAENSWAYYANFVKMLSGSADSYIYPGAPAAKIVTVERLRKILQTYNFGDEFDHWLENVYAKMIADKSSYIGPKFQSTLDERKQVVLNVVQQMRKPSTNSTADLDELVSDYELLNDKLGLTEEEQWIYCGMILAKIQKSNLTLDELLTKPEVKSCLESKAN